MWEAMSKLILYHGTSEVCARQIAKEGFIPDKHYNWAINSSKGFIFLSLAYAPFYSLKHTGDTLAIIKVEVDTAKCYPEDDFIMRALGKPVYTQEDLEQVKLKNYKTYWKNSLKAMGNVAVKARNIKILGITYFNRKGLLLKCDPVICPANFLVLGSYYQEMSEWLWQGKDIKDFRGMFDES